MYTTNGKVANLLGLADETVIKSDWIEWAEAELELRVGKSFDETIVTNEVYDGSGIDEMILNKYPITGVSKVEYLTAYHPIEVWEELSSIYYRLYAKEGIVKLVPDLSGCTDISSFGVGVQNWRFNYKYGYTSVPKEVELLASLLVVELYYKSTGQSDTISKEKIGDYSSEYGSEDNTTSISDLIDVIIQNIKKGKFTVKVI